MKERDETKSVLKYYRFVLLRVRMPDNYIVQGEGCASWTVNPVQHTHTPHYHPAHILHYPHPQPSPCTQSSLTLTSHPSPCTRTLPSPIPNAGVFRPLERVSDVRAFILGALSTEAFPFNLLSLGKTLEDDNATLAELGLVRSAFITSSLITRHIFLLISVYRRKQS